MAKLKFVTGSGKIDLMGILFVFSYRRKYTLDEILVDIQTIPPLKTTILCLPSGVIATLMRTVVASGEAFAFLHSIRHPLHETEVCSHDANVAMTMKVVCRSNDSFTTILKSRSHYQERLQTALDICFPA